jgi:hypothetical protein
MGRRLGAVSALDCARLLLLPYMLGGGTARAEGRSAGVWFTARMEQGEANSKGLERLVDRLEDLDRGLGDFKAPETVSGPLVMIFNLLLGEAKTQQPKDPILAVIAAAPEPAPPESPLSALAKDPNAPPPPEGMNVGTMRAAIGQVLIVLGTTKTAKPTRRRPR